MGYLIVEQYLRISRMGIHTPIFIDIYGRFLLGKEEFFPFDTIVDANNKIEFLSKKRDFTSYSIIYFPKE